MGKGRGVSVRQPDRSRGQERGDVKGWRLFLFCFLLFLFSFTLGKRKSRLDELECKVRLVLNESSMLERVRCEEEDEAKRREEKRG
jgi:hypothetical protein